MLNNFYQSCKTTQLFRFIFLLLLSFTVSANDTSLANQLFKKHQKQVFQVKIIDIASGDRYSYGSGFLISSEGYVASNFHVISSIVHEPEKFRIELINHQGKKQSAQLLAIDVVHDLSILKIDASNQTPLNLNKIELSQGDRLYSMGNPLDLGMSIIEGTYNGFVNISRYKKILFSGSLNSGMSGGPALDKNGDVIGINVAKGAEHVSFLVPVKHLYQLIKKANNSDPNINFKEEIEKSLLSDQNSFYNDLLGKTIKLQPLGQFNLPTKISDSLKCWGHTVDDEDIKYSSVHQHCISTDRIFIDDELSTGSFKLDFEWIKAEELNRFQFYNYLQTRFELGLNIKESREKHMNDYTCATNFISLMKRTWKLASCKQSYKDYSKILDTFNVMMLIDSNDYSLVLRMTNIGVSAEKSQQLFIKLAESIEWIE